MGLQATTQQQQELKQKILEMEHKQANLDKEITRLLAFQTGGVGFTLHQDRENIAGIKNLLNAPAEGKVSEILDFLDNLDMYKQYLLTGEVQAPESTLVSQPSIQVQQKLHAVIGDENPVLPLGRGYAMVTTEVQLLEGGEKAVVGLITPIHLLAKERNLELLDALSKVFSPKDQGSSLASPNQ